MARLPESERCTIRVGRLHNCQSTCRPALRYDSGLKSSKCSKHLCNKSGLRIYDVKVH